MREKLLTWCNTPSTTQERLTMFTLLSRVFSAQQHQSTQFGRKIFCGLILTVIATALPVTTHAAVTIIHHFAPGKGGNGPDGNPGLIYDGNKLYGVTLDNRDNNLDLPGNELTRGTVFSMNPDGSDFTTLHNFSGTDGRNPFSSLVRSGNTLYGTTNNGGANDFGTVFKLRTDGTDFQTLHTFSNDPSDGGSEARGSLILDGSTLYGTNFFNVNGPGGSVFRLQTDGSGFTRLKALTGTEGTGLIAGLAINNSKLYGVAAAGGTSSFGTIFSMDTEGTNFNVLHHFSGGAGGGDNPLSHVIIHDDILYGTTDDGGVNGDGTIYKMNLDGTGFSILHEFNSLFDGRDPEGSLLLFEDRLYGITEDGTSPDNGIIYSIGLDGSNFQIVDTLGFVGQAEGELLLIGDTLYGMTIKGGDHDLGTIFAVQIPEPATLSLLALGSAALIKRRRSQRI